MIEGGDVVRDTHSFLHDALPICDFTALNTRATNLNASSNNGDVVLNNNLATAVGLTTRTKGSDNAILYQTVNGAVTATTATTGNGSVSLSNTGAGLTVGGNVAAG